MAFLPSTKGRLVTSVNLKASVIKKDIGNDKTLPDTTRSLFALPPKKGLATGQQINSQFIELVTIGTFLDATSKLTIKQSRETTRIYALGEYAFEPFHIVPGPITTDLDLQRVVLYARDFFEALGFAQGSIGYQMIPFLIDVELRAPTGAYRTLRFHDCWVKGHTLPFDISGTQALVMQDLQVTAGKVETSEATFGGLGYFTKSIISAVPLPQYGQ